MTVHGRLSSAAKHKTSERIYPTPRRITLLYGADSPETNSAFHLRLSSIWAFHLTGAINRCRGNCRTTAKHLVESDPQLRLSGKPRVRQWFEVALVGFGVEG